MITTTSVDHLISRPAQLARCPHCTIHVLVGIDGGATVICDLDALNIHAEIAAILTHRSTYNLVSYGAGKAYLQWRYLERIRNPAREHPVMRDHICPDGHHPIISWHIPKKSKAPRKSAPVVNDDSPIPF